MKQGEKSVVETQLRKGQSFVYLYSDTRINRVGQPIYVGIGKTKRDGSAYRIRVHWFLCGRHRNPLFRGVLSKIKAAGCVPTIEIVKVFETYEEAKTEERCLITLYGQRIHRTGTLCNITGGGDGALGLHLTHTPEAKQKISEASKQRWSDPVYRQRLSESAKAFHTENPDAVLARTAKVVKTWTPEKRAVTRAEVLERLKDPEMRRQISDAIKSNKVFTDGARQRMTELNAQPGFVERRALKIKQAYESPELRRKTSERMKAFCSSEEGRAAKSAAMKKLWKDDAYREKMIAERSARVPNESTKASMKRGIAAMSSELKAELSRKRSEAAKARWANPNFKAKVSAAIKLSNQTP